ncbi:MAG: chromate transporter [Alistipes sp.]|nr:chromate transporter [Alistipes sp.]MDE6507505.1 chromate transporter [Alistipes sp.]
MQTLLVIFGSFFKIGLFTFGGGYAMIPLIEREVIDRRGWVERREFLDLLTLAQSVPGPIAVNTAVFVGYRMRGVRGALAALWGTILPSFTIILLIALFFADIRHNPVVDAAFKGMRPAVVALIIGPVVSLARGMRWPMFAVIAAAALAIWGLGWSPVYVLAAAAAAGIGWELAVAGKAGKRRQHPAEKPENANSELK